MKFLRHAAFISCRRCFDHENHALTVLESAYQKMHNGRVKIITGIRRCGKSYLLFELFGKYLRENGVQDEQIVELALDEIQYFQYRNPFELDAYIRRQITDKTKQYYVMIDEIQFVSEVPNPYVNDDSAKIGFSDVLLGLMKIKNADIYVTGSNSKMLSSDVLAQFRDRGDEIRVYPLVLCRILLCILRKTAERVARILHLRRNATCSLL